MAARHLPPLRTFTPAPETQRQTESHRRATSSPGSHTSVFGLSPMAHTLDMAEQDTGTAIAAERTKTPVERTPSPPLGSTNVSRDQEGLSRTPSGRSFSARKRILAGVLGESPLPVLLLGGIAMLLLLALLLKNNTITLSAALYDVRQHLRLAFRGGPTRPPRFSLRVKCGSDTVPSGPIGSSEGCLVIAPSCSETWVAVLDAGEERVIDGLCRDESAGVALITQRCDGTCRDIPPEQQNKPQDVWTPILTKEFVIDSIGAKGALAGSICGFYSLPLPSLCMQLTGRFRHR